MSASKKIHIDKIIDQLGCIFKHIFYLSIEGKDVKKVTSRQLISIKKNQYLIKHVDSLSTTIKTIYRHKTALSFTAIRLRNEESDNFQCCH